ncbi:MAG: hypothetical protein COW32_00945 [Candidatus Aquicultor secundus]|uniref:Putative amidase domain-containing protein n=2 Tax=Candidatus Aquicultor secundus TaxID=1973895 RepID=A0A2M7T8L0_9ACTN|nr:amidase domain-containing protein [Candidatus Aquicultor secundus]PIU26996.1 MAG: hypothetical protein COT10_05765 [Candidatus Aquicultor secundus]PIW23127.1 MAG: hypothetical protein COW32_00945 [Candidatus Aquicultor secundus]PIY38241.1 MAG: hypothetical protein COZ03_08610 [Candidatus Aquicultor secundus]PIZ39959.1 MAG: hypothetical protein COY37_04470 [Candidatus Aquicultor secundus]PJB81218.1 MAG: hypothetical protein CO091_00170 [Candidatus Aquicultor secundus]
MYRLAKVLTCMLIIMGTMLSAGIAFGYSGTGAAYYADVYATSRNSSYPSFSSDCTNFVSQAMHTQSGSMGGGYPFRWSGSLPWYCYKSSSGWQYTTAWVRANTLRSFLINDYPGGYDWGVYSPQQSNSNIATYGDAIFYDWQSDGWWDHASMEVAYSSTDPNSGYHGDLVDQHTTDRYHAIWNLWPYNDNRWTTKIDIMHIDSSN